MIKYIDYIYYYWPIVSAKLLPISVRSEAEPSIGSQRSFHDGFRTSCPGRIASPSSRRRARSTGRVSTRPGWLRARPPTLVSGEGEGPLLHEGTCIPISSRNRVPRDVKLLDNLLDRLPPDRKLAPDPRNGSPPPTKQAFDCTGSMQKKWIFCGAPPIAATASPKSTWRQPANCPDKPSRPCHPRLGCRVVIHGVVPQSRLGWMKPISPPGAEMRLH